jgi:Asp-tRNA(Asn)/Glu-tRNA(Gln) amidotransferase B subunit
MAAPAAASRLVRGRASLWEVCVGLEVHAQVLTATKLFSGAQRRGGGSEDDDAVASLSSSAAAPPPPPSPLASVAGALLGGGAAASSGPNSAVALFDAGHPGTLPRLNRACVDQALRAGMALRCALPPVSAFERKHYNYPDLPLGYQVTQLAQPVALDGHVQFTVPTRGGKRGGGAGGGGPPVLVPRVCGIARVQLEQDSGKSVHTLVPGRSLVDLSRAGAALLEVVGAPDLRSAEEAQSFLRGLQALLVHAGVTDGAFELGSLRADVNVSLRPVEEAYAAEVSALEVDAVLQSLIGVGGGGAASSSRPPPPLWYSDGGYAGRYVKTDTPEPSTWSWIWDSPAAPTPHPPSSPPPSPPPATPLLAALLSARALHFPGFGPRVEMKNLNSLRAVHRAVEHETARQIAILEGGGQVERETRLFDAQSRTSVRLRGKEDEADYRFLPEPDLAPILLPASRVQALLATLPELLEDVAARFTRSHGLSHADAATLVGEPGAPAYFERAVAAACAAHAGIAGAAPPPETARALAKATANWVLNELFGGLAERGTTVRAAAVAVEVGGGEEEGEEMGGGKGRGVGTGRSAADAATRAPVSPARLGQLVALVEAGVVSGKRAKDVLQLMLGARLGGGGGAAAAAAAEATAAVAPPPLPEGSTAFAAPDPRSPHAIVMDKGWAQLNDRDPIVRLAVAAVADPALAETVAKWRGQGQERALGSVVAAILQASGGLANPELASACAKEALGPLGQRPEGKVGRKEKARQAAEAAAAVSQTAPAAPLSRGRGGGR